MRRLITAGLLVFIMTTSCAWAQPPKLISCEKTGNDDGNQECVYEVVGQRMHDPSSLTKLYGMSNMQYALCSSAVCETDKNKPGLAACKCKVFGLDDNEAKWRKASVGPKTFAKSKAVKTRHQLISVTSTFSFADLDKQSQMKSRTCKYQKPTAWANCFGVRCRIDKNSEGVTVTCNCPVVKTKEFISMGPSSRKECDLPDGKVWSAATATQGDNDFGVIQDMYKKFYPESPMIKK